MKYPNDNWRLVAPPVVLNGFPTVGGMVFPTYTAPPIDEPIRTYDFESNPEGYTPRPWDIFQVQRDDLEEVRYLVDNSGIDLGDQVYKVALFENYLWLVRPEDADDFEELCDMVFWDEDFQYFDDDLTDLDIPDYFIRIARL